LSFLLAAHTSNLKIHTLVVGVQLTVAFLMKTKLENRLNSKKIISVFLLLERSEERSKVLGAMKQRLVRHEALPSLLPSAASCK